jgi:hypothetical protein
LLRTFYRYLSKLGTAVDTESVTAHPTGRIRREKGDRSGNVLRPGDAFQRLDAKDEVTPLILAL